MQSDGLGDEETSEFVCRFCHPGLPVALVSAWLPRPRQQPIDHIVEQVVLIAHVVVERHRRHLELGGEASDGHLPIAPGLYDLRRCCDHLLARDRPPRGAPARTIGLLRYLESSGRPGWRSYRINIAHLRTCTSSVMVVLRIRNPVAVKRSRRPSMRRERENQMRKPHIVHLTTILAAAAI